MCTAMDSPCSSDTQEDILSKLDSRKSNKPLMEKKRRQRINRCLNELKSLVLEGMRKDPSRYSKLEKADILEMTVRHVQALHRHEGVACRLGSGPRLMGGGRPLGSDGRTKYRAGFIHCAVEVTRYLAGMSGVPHDLHHRLISHLNTVTSSLTCVPGVGQLPGASVVVGGGVVTVAPPAASRPDAPAVTTTPTDASRGVSQTLGAPSVPPCRSPPPSHFSGSGIIPSVSTTLASGTGVALVPAGIVPQQAPQVLASSPGHPQFPLSLTTTHSVPPEAAKADLAFSNSEAVLVPLNYQLPKNVIVTVPKNNLNSHEAASSIPSSDTFTPRSLPLASSTLTPLNDADIPATSITHTVQEISNVCTQAVTSAKQSHATTSTSSISDPHLYGPVTPSPESPDKDSSSRADPLGLQVSVRLSSTTSPPVLPTSLWSSQFPLRPTPTLPASVQHTSSASPLLSPISSPSSSSPLSSSSSCSSSPSCSNSTIASQGLPQHAPALDTPPCTRGEPLDLAPDRLQNVVPRPHLKVLSALPWSRPSPYPLPHRQPPGPSHPWRPW